MGVGVVLLFGLDFNLTCAGLARIQGEGVVEPRLWPCSAQGTLPGQHGLDLGVSREGPSTTGFGPGGPITC